MTLHVSLAPETVFHIGSLTITNSILTGWILTLFMLVGALILRAGMTKVPGGFQSIIEMAYEWLFDTTEKIVQHKEATREVIPFILTLFFFILISNWSGLLPGFGSLGLNEVHYGKEALTPLLRAPTSDLNMVLVLSFFSMAYVQYLGLKYAGFKVYLSRFFNFSSPIGFFVGILELIGEFTRIISFTFRLFGNIFAGEVLIGVMFFLTLTLLPQAPFIPIPFFLLELFVGAIQAFIFCFLTIVFVSLAVISHDSEGHEHGGEDLTLARKVADAEHTIEHEILHKKPNMETI